jgi:hypothetical protein
MMIQFGDVLNDDENSSIKGDFFTFFLVSQTQIKKLATIFHFIVRLMTRKKSVAATAIAFISHTRKKSERFLFIEKKNGTVFPFEGKFSFLSFLIFFF